MSVANRLLHHNRLDVPLMNVFWFFLVESFLLCGELDSQICVSCNRLRSEPVGFFERSGFLALVFKPWTHILVDKFSRVKNEVAVFDHHVGNPLVEICDLWYFSCFKKLGEPCNFWADRVVIVSKLMWPDLQLFGLLGNKCIDPLVLLWKVIKLATEVIRPLTLFNFDLTSDRLKIVNIFGAFFVFNC